MALPFRRWGDIAPSSGAQIDWGKAPSSLRYAVVLGQDTGSAYQVVAPTIAGDAGVNPIESVHGEAVQSLDLSDPMKHAEGNYWGGTPTTQASTQWVIPTPGASPAMENNDRLTVVWRQWTETTHGVGNGGNPFWNQEVGATRCQVYSPLNPTGYGFWRFGNGTPGQGVLEFTEPDLLTDYHTLMVSASTGVLQPAGMRAFMDGCRVLGEADVWSGSKPDNSASFAIGRGYWGVISFVYIFDDYVTDIGFLEEFTRQPYYIFAEPNHRAFSFVPPTPIDLAKGIILAITDQSVLKVDQMSGTNGLTMLAGAWIPSTDDTRTAGIIFADYLGRRFRLRLETADAAYQQVRINGTPTYSKTRDLLQRVRDDPG